MNKLRAKLQEHAPRPSLVVLAATGLAMAYKAGRQQKEAQQIDALPTSAEVERGTIAMLTLNERWDMGLNRQQAELAAYVVQKSGGEQGVKEDVTQEERQQISEDVHHMVTVQRVNIQGLHDISQHPGNANL